MISVIFRESEQLGKSITEANTKTNVLPWQRSWPLPTAEIGFFKVAKVALR